MKHLTTLAALLTTIFACVQSAHAFLGTDISGDYGYSDSLNPTDPDSPTHSFTSIAGTGTAGPSGDDNTSVVDIGFDFEFYGNIYDSVLISTNGFISFDTSAGSGCCSGDEIPDSTGINNFVAGNWSDLSTTGGNIYYQTSGVAPSRRFTVEYASVGYLSGGSDITMQIELIEGVDQILIRIETDGDGARDVTIGIENADGTDGIEYYYGYTNAIDLNGQTISFFPRRDAPRLSVVTEETSIPEGGSLEFEVTAIDRQGDPVTIEWDLDLDGEYDDETGETVTLSADGLDGPTMLQVGVRASDPSDNADERVIEIPVTNAPPVVTNLPEGPFDVLIGEEFTFTPEVEDPGDDEITVEVIDRPAGMVLLAEGGIRWEPNDLQVGMNSVTFLVYDDEDDPDVEGDGDANFVLEINVSENLGPEIPTIISPERNEEVDVARPTLVIGNPTDPEGDILTIAFEVDSSDTFPAPIASGYIQAGPDGETSWEVTEDLMDGERYYWRVWAFDGDLESPRASSTFTVELSGGDGDGDADGDADGDGDGDGDGDADADPGETTVEGCGCNAGGSGAPPAEALLMLVIAAGLIFRRIRVS